MVAVGGALGVDDALPDAARMGGRHTRRWSSCGLLLGVLFGGRFSRVGWTAVQRFGGCSGTDSSLPVGGVIGVLVLLIERRDGPRGELERILSVVWQRLRRDWGVGIRGSARVCWCGSEWFKLQADSRGPFVKQRRRAVGRRSARFMCCSRHMTRNRPGQRVFGRRGRGV
jgi:hypothetical protein